jgi:hypothetical protein
MLTLQEQKELRKKVANDQITIQLAKEIYWKDLNDESRSWHTKDWKDRREKLLKDKCEICNSKEALTIQHLTHPRKYNDYENEITRKYTTDYENNNSTPQQNDFLEYITKNYNYLPVPLCPKCDSRKPNKRMRKTPVFLCTNCHHEFDETNFYSIEKLVAIFYENEESIEAKDKCFVSKDKWENQHNLRQIRYWLLRNETKSNNASTIEKEAFLLYLDDNIKYLSFTDTITACKKCASNYDLNNLELCPNCKEFYKGIQYPICIQCLPEDKQKVALEKVEFGKKWRAIEKDLGID